MPNRRDAMAGAARMIACLEKIAQAHAPHAVATVGMLRVHPNSRNVVPGRVAFSINMRHPEEAVLAAINAEMRRRFAAIASEQRLELALERVANTDVVNFHARSAWPPCAMPPNVLGTTATSSPVPTRAASARWPPRGMISLPCEGGLSHNEIGRTRRPRTSPPAGVLLHALLSAPGSRRRTR